MKIPYRQWLRDLAGAERTRCKIILIKAMVFFYIGKNGYLCFGKDNYRQVYIINEKE